MKKAVVLLLIILTMLFTFGACGETQGPKTIRISFDTDGKVYVASMKVVLGEVPQIPETPQVEGYVFAGWYFDEELTNRYFFDYALEESATLYAKFYDLTLGEYTVISNVEQLIAIKDAPDAKYLLACDINCKGETLEPITTFSGELDGNGYKIFNFSITKDSENVAFISINKGTVKNLYFADFVYDVTTGSTNSKYHGIIAGRNTSLGIIQNCHVLDSELKVRTYTNSELSIYIGSIVGLNEGVVENCNNNTNINAQGLSGGCAIFYGGIAGYVKNGKVINCANYGKLNYYTEDQDWANSSYGGIVGSNNNGVIDGCVNLGDINLEIKAFYNSTTQANISAFVGYNTGEIKNCYTSCEFKINALKCHSNSRIGGFVGYNNGKIYNCYSNVNIDANTNNFPVGGFVGYNCQTTGKESVISKCFVLGSVIVNKTPTDYGYFAGKNTGSIQIGIYSNTLTMSLKTIETNAETGESVEVLTALEPTCTEGEVKEQSELLSVNFLENTLYFDRMVWLLVEGELPTLR